MNKNIKDYLKISSTISFICYLLKAFVIWDLTFIFRLGELTPHDRVGCVCSYATIHFASFAVWWIKKLD